MSPLLSCMYIAVLQYIDCSTSFTFFLQQHVNIKILWRCRNYGWFQHLIHIIDRWITNTWIKCSLINVQPADSQLTFVFWPLPDNLKNSMMNTVITGIALIFKKDCKLNEIISFLEIQLKKSFLNYTKGFNFFNR